MRRTVTVGLIAATLLALVGCSAGQWRSATPVEARALWITRWDYRAPEDVERIVENAASLNFNILLFQVRGNGTVFYPSEIEPWAWELTSDGPETTGQDPGWDPLALAIELAHARGMELHAYANVFPAWRTQDYPPRDSGQLWWEHPEWFMADAAGNRMIPRDVDVPYSDPVYGGPLANVSRERPPGDWYAFINPAHPEVQAYLADLFTELAANYDIDGIHFDYIRYPAEIREVAEGHEDRVAAMGNWSYDSLSLERFTADTDVATPEDDPEAWTQWRADQITEVVQQIREGVDSVRRGVLLSAAVMADPADAHDTKFQDYVVWMERGLLDAAITMNYTSDDQRFLERSEALLEVRPSRGWIMPGMSLGNDIATVSTQIEMTRELPVDGFAGFAYSHLFDRDNNHIAKPLAEQLATGPLAEPRALPW